jgi:hypothetical protein
MYVRNECGALLVLYVLCSAHDQTKIENLEKEKAQLEELNRMLKGSSDDDSTSDLDTGDV